MDPQSIIRNFIQSIPGGGRGAGGRAAPQQKLFTTLQDLLTPASSVPWIESISENEVDQLLQFLPPQLITLARESEDDGQHPLTMTEKRAVVQKVLRSPQFSQSLASLTFALRDGGLPSISEALNIAVQNGGYMRRGGVPLGGGEAVEAFLNGVKDSVEKGGAEDDDTMDTQ